jgi:hypothetical protein
MAIPSDKNNFRQDIKLVVPGMSSLEGLAESRTMVCSQCPRNKDGVCEIVAAKHKPHRSIIENGVRRLSCACPLGLWNYVPVICPSCERLERVNEHFGMCKWCLEKVSTGRRNKNPFKYSRSYDINRDVFANNFKKHLYFFLYPKYENSVLYHIEQLKKSIDLFDGKRVCVIAIDGQTIHEQFRFQLEEIFTDVITVANDPKQREKVGFVPALKIIASRYKDGAICFAHGKGQQQHTHNSLNINHWNDVMYETCVRNWEEVKVAMESGYPVAGSFKSTSAFQTTPHKWHYSGAFWWGRSKRIFENRRWQEMCNRWWGAESYVGKHFSRDEGYCLFRPLYRGESLYESSTWEKVLPDLEQWREEHESFRSNT